MTDRDLTLSVMKLDQPEALARKSGFKKAGNDSIQEHSKSLTSSEIVSEQLMVDKNAHVDPYVLVLIDSHSHPVRFDKMKCADHANC